jgi:transcriptional regulator GlxA family with amidase domain
LRRVVIAIFGGVQALDVAGPLDVFSEANEFVAAADRYALTIAAATAAPVRASNGTGLVADATFDAARGPWDIALVAGGPGLPGGPVDAALVAWLRDVAARQPCHGAICTGAFALGAAGLLDDRTVTTHWQHAARLARRFDRARVEPDRIFCRDGALITSAGVTAGIDLALALVGEHHGPAVALAVAKRLVVFAQRQGGQSQFSPYLVPTADEGAPMSRVQAYVIAHLDTRTRLSVEKLAEVAGMSARHFARSFVEWAGVTPREFVERARVDAARALLESTARPLKTIAWDCGFGSADRMRIVFAKRLGVTPARYRESFSVDAGGLRRPASSSASR